MGFTQVGFIYRKAEVFLSLMGSLLGMKCVLGKASLRVRIRTTLGQPYYEEFQATHVNISSQVALVLKNLLANARDPRDEGSIPGSGRSPGEGNSKPLQYCCLENPTDRGAW